MISELEYEIWKITEWKDGCVNKTEKVGVIWLPMEMDHEDPLIVQSSVLSPTGRSRMKWKGAIT